MKQGPFTPGRLCCPPHHRYYDPLRLPLDRPPLPGFTGYRQHRFPTPAGSGPRRPSPVPTTTFQPFHAPCAGRFLGTSSRTSGAVHGLRPRETGSAPPCPAHRAGVPNDAAGFASCCGPVSCSPPHRGFVAPLRPPGSHPASGAALPRTLASPRTGLTPAGCRELVARLRHNAILSVMAPELLDTLPAGTAGQARRASAKPPGTSTRRMTKTGGS